MTGSPEGARAALLRRIAAEEIARHREALGYLGAALEGSLATVAVWPSSDADFTVIPRPEHSPERLLEWERQELLPFLKDHPDRRIHIDVCGQRDGIPWHKHLTDRRALEDLLKGYPSSIIRPAEGPFDPGPLWFLDGLAVMEVVDDPTGLLQETRRFVAARRFTPEVWEGRRAALLQELRRKLDQSRAALEGGEAEAAYESLSGDTGFAAVAAQLWLESAHRLTSSKEQDGQLAAVTAAAGCSEAHALYRRTMAVVPDRVRAVEPLLLPLGERASSLYQRMGAWPPDDLERHREAVVWEAYVAHLIGTLSLAHGRGHPAYVYRSLPTLLHWTIEYPGRWIGTLREEDVPRDGKLSQHALEVASLAAQVHTTLLDPTTATTRARACTTAAEQLLNLSESRL